MKKPAEKSDEFLGLLTDWQIVEDKTIACAEETINGARNPLVRMVMEVIKHDSEKHKIILQLIRDTITTEAMRLGPDELASLSDTLNRHMEMEAGALALADEAYRKSELFSTRFLLSILMADEAKHHAILKQLDELKRASIPSSTGTRSGENQ